MPSVGQWFAMALLVGSGEALTAVASAGTAVSSSARETAVQQPQLQVADSGVATTHPDADSASSAIGETTLGWGQSTRCGNIGLSAEPCHWGNDHRDAAATVGDDGNADVALQDGDNKVDDDGKLYSDDQDDSDDQDIQQEVIFVVIIGTILYVMPRATPTPTPPARLVAVSEATLPPPRHLTAPRFRRSPSCCGCTCLSTNSCAPGPRREPDNTNSLRDPLLTREEERRGIFANSLAEDEVGTARCADKIITSIRLPASHFAPFLAFARATCDPA